MPSISAKAKEQIQSALESATSGTGVPGLVFCAIDKKGNFLAENAVGMRGLDVDEPMTMDSTFYIASCTKMITGLAAMQLVEQGKIGLDSAEDLYKVAPEIKEKKVLVEGGKLVDRKGDITLRKLLTHTAGFGYSFFNEKLMKYNGAIGLDEFSGDKEDYLMQPLVNQPGSRWEYGINIDWAGIVVERISGLSLDDYFKKNIFKPLGIENISFKPSQQMRENMVTMQQRERDGVSHDTDHVARRMILHADDTSGRMFQAGGAGCFAKPKDYCLILTTLLNNGISPTTNERILKSETVDEMFKNQIPEFPDFARNSPLPNVKASLSNPAPEIYPQGGNPPQGWGLTFFNTIAPGETGRGANTGWWAGITNLFWWCDREKGVAGMIAGQILPFGDANVLGAWFGAEKAIYDGLEA